MNRYVKRGWRPTLGALAVGAFVFGLSLQGAPAGDSTELASARSVESAGTAATAAAVAFPAVDDIEEHLPQRVAAPSPLSADRAASEPAAVDASFVAPYIHQGRILGSTPVGSGGGAAAGARGGLALGEPCSCDQDCDQTAADGCNIVQCIVRSLCTGDNTTLCSVDEDCAVAGGVCDPNLAVTVQRCDTVQLIDWACEAGNGFCSLDRCADDGTGTEHSVCVAQFDDGGDGTNGASSLSACAKACDGGPNLGKNCGDANDCPGQSSPGVAAKCVQRTGGACDDASESCYVGTPGNLSTAIGRCCDGTQTCLGEMTEAACTTAGGDWYRYRSPLQQVGDTFCECGKYSSGVTPNGADIGSTGLVRPSALVCQIGSDVELQAGRFPIDCEDLDGDGFSPNFCQKRCQGGDNATGVCQTNVDCGLVGTCGISGAACVPSLGGSDCPDAGDVCNPTDPGTCEPDPCGPNTFEGGCADGFLNIGDDYSLANGSYLRLTQFRYRGGVSNQGEQVVFEFWTADNSTLIDAFAFTPNRPGVRDWDIEVDCWPNCDPLLGEVAEPNPIIIPPDGIVKMRSVRTIGTIAGSAAFWDQTDTVDAGTNDPAVSLRDDVLGDFTNNVYIFELLGQKIDDPLGACCSDDTGATCTNTHRWECGLCSDLPDGTPVGTILCGSTLNDCPQGGLTGSFCQFNRWFGPISHTDFVFGGTDLQLCAGAAPCDRGSCCLPDGSCAVLTSDDCATQAGSFLGVATTCEPNCCPQPATGSDCACETKLCQDDGTLEFTADLCEVNADCGAGFSCVVRCTPNAPEVLRHPYTCFDSFPSEILPQVPCDPNNGDADCNVGAGETCRQSFTTTYNVVKTDTITPDFNVADGEVCSLNTSADNVGWYELFALEDRTPGDTTDDCFQVTVGLCCTDPVLTPIWPFVNQFLSCPCKQSADIDGIAPDFDEGNNQLDGFGANSLANVACNDGNYSATFTLPPGDNYAYQVNSATNCAQSTTPCEDDTDCPGTSCVVPNPNYTVQFNVQSCDKAACCTGDSCLVTNELDCDARGGAYLGNGDNPIVRCPPDIPNPCALGSCCLDGTCDDSAQLDEPGECAAAGGVFVGGITDCALQPCPACPIDSPANCQQVQTIFGPIPLADRNTDNGQGGAAIGISRVVSDDIKFDGTVVDDICWNAGMYDSGINGCAQSGGFDNTWEIRVYEDDVTGAIPGAQICMSTLSVLNKVEGTGQATATWSYSGRLDTPCNLPNGGVGGDTYWIEISGFGDSGCSVRATWSRDNGNEHAAWQAIDATDGRLGYQLSQVLNLDVGFCENDGITTPDPVLGVCCTCGAVNCTDATTQSDCLDNLRGVWRAAETCSQGTCPAAAVPNDDCSTPEPVSGVPTDGTALALDINNICATDDGPPLDATFNGGCRGSVTGNGEFHDDIWFAYTAEACGTLQITSCNEADNDQMIAIYDGDVGCPVLTDDELACNDDGCTGSGSAGPSTVTLAVNEGQNLLIRVGGWNDEVPGGFNGDPRGFMTLNWSFLDLCPSVMEPLPAPPPHDILKNRYISLAPQNPGINHHLQLTMTSTQVNGATTGGVYWAGQPDANCISLVSPVKPVDPPDWTGCSTAHLTGCPIIPTSEYEIRAVSATGEFSAGFFAAQTQTLPAEGKWWGDSVGQFLGNEWTPPQGVTNFDDVNAAIKTFQKPDEVGPVCANPPCNAVHVSRSDVEPNNTGIAPFAVVNKLTNFADVQQFILAFQGGEYPGNDLGNCQ